MAVIPGHEVGSAIAAFQVDARNLQRRIRIGSGGDDNRVVIIVELRQRNVRPDIHVAMEGNIAPLKNIKEGVNNRLDSRMIGGHPIAN